jgi:hypothetical protein
VKAEKSVQARHPERSTACECVTGRRDEARGRDTRRAVWRSEATRVRCRRERKRCGGGAGENSEGEVGRLPWWRRGLGRRRRRPGDGEGSLAQLERRRYPCVRKPRGASTHRRGASSRAKSSGHGEATHAREVVQQVDAAGARQGGRVGGAHDGRVQMLGRASTLSIQALDVAQLEETRII